VHKIIKKLNMRLKFILPFLFVALFLNVNATELADDDSKKIEDLEAEINFLKLENAKLKSTTSNSASNENGPNLKIRDKVKRPLGKDWYVTVSAGYGIPFITTNKKSPLKEIGEGDWQQSPGALSRKSMFGTNGGGFAFNFGWGHMFNKHIGIDVLHTFAWHPESLDARINTTSEGPLGTSSYYATQKTSTFGMYISPHLVMRWDNGKRFGITGKAGLVAPIFGNTTSRANIDDNSGRLLQTLNGIPPIIGIPFIHMTLDAVAKTSYKPTLGVSTSIGFDVKLSKRVWMYAEARIQAYTIKLVQTVMNEFKMQTSLKLGETEIPLSIADDLIKDISGGLLSLASLTGGLPLNINSAAEAPKFLTHYNYVDEITEESNTARYGTRSLIAGPLNLTGLPPVDLDKPMDEPGQKFNTSTMYFNLGLRVDFDLWDKKRKDKTSKKQDL
jgi:hypothetical protein